MATPVVADKWAGNFDCGFCRRKRLMGSEFSKKALEKYRKTGGSLKCKECVAEAEQAERAAATAKRATTTTSSMNDSGSTTGTLDTIAITCMSCEKALIASAYNRNQWNKGEGKARCRDCVETALAQESAQIQQSKDTAMQEAQNAVAEANASGNTAAILKAESMLSALEAEKVTGLKPVRMSGRGGRGRPSARGRGKR
jgi:hypothetical protein